MPDPIITDPPIGADDSELATLRRVNAELLQTKHTLKARIATLEGQAATLESRAEKAESTMRAAVIDRPLKRLAAEVSDAPDLFIAELSKDYDVIADDDGGIGLQTKDGKRVAPGGSPLEFTHSGLYQLLAGKPHEAKTPRSRVFTTLMKYIGASGGAGRKVTGISAKSSAESNTESIAPAFGLR